MAEGRMLKRSIATSEQLERVSFEADYLFTRCIPFLDVEGRMPGAPGRVRALVCPLRPEMTPDVVARCLTELRDAGLVEWYDSAAGQVLAFPGFHRHNMVRRDREGASKLPGPPTAPSALPDRATPGGLPEHSRRTPALSKGKSGEDKRSGAEAEGPVGAHDAPAHARAHDAARTNPPARSAPLRAPHDGAREELSDPPRYGDLPEPLADEPLASLVWQLRRERYPDAAPPRWADVVRQLCEALTPEGTTLRRGQAVRTTPAVLARALQRALREPIENADRTVVVVLRKCMSGDAVTPPNAKGQLPTEERAAHDAAERAAEARDLAARQRDVDAWLVTHPEERAALEAQLEAERPNGVPDSAFWARARAVRLVQLVEQRQASAPLAAVP